MRMRLSHFDNGLEVDCLGQYQGRKRMSIRRPTNDRYEVYTFDYLAKKEEVVCSGTLEECLTYTNRITGYHDVVDIE